MPAICAIINYFNSIFHILENITIINILRNIYINYNMIQQNKKILRVL